MYNNEASPWIHLPDSGWTRTLKGEDPNTVKHRVAFIEKTPQVRLRNTQYGVEVDADGRSGVRYQTNDGWLSSYGSNLEDDKRWCDRMLVLLGYDLGTPDDNEPITELWLQCLGFVAATQPIGIKTWKRDGIEIWETNNSWVVDALNRSEISQEFKTLGQLDRFWLACGRPALLINY